MATNTLGNYNADFYAMEGLKILETSLAFAGKLYRGYDTEYGASRTRGEFIKIPKPSTFTAQNAPSVAQDLDTGTRQIQLNNWKDVVFEVPDDEHAYTGERIINDHIRPAVYALARDINIAAAALTLQCPHIVQVPSTMTIDHIPDARAILAKTGGLMNDNRQYAVIHSDHEAGLLKLAAFSQNQGAGSAGDETQRTGNIGQKYGFMFAQDPQMPSIDFDATVTVPGTWQLSAAASKNATSITTDGVGAAGVGNLEAGAIIYIGGTNNESNRYAVTSTVAMSDAMTINVSPPLRSDYADNAAVALAYGDDTHDSTYESLLFHESFGAIAFGRLPDTMPRATSGAQIASVQNQQTGFSLRSMLWYDATNKKMMGSLDVLYGLTVLDADKAVRMARYG